MECNTLKWFSETHHIKCPYAAAFFEAQMKQNAVLILNDKRRPKIQRPN